MRRPHIESLSRSRTRGISSTTLLPVRDVHGVVISISVDELVVGINSGPRGSFLHQELEALTVARDPLLAQGERLFLVLLAAEDADVD